jgi:uncharacterized protein (TIGR03000 family)
MYSLILSAALLAGGETTSWGQGNCGGCWGCHGGSSSYYGGYGTYGGGSGNWGCSGWGCQGCAGRCSGCYGFGSGYYSYYAYPQPYGNPGIPPIQQPLPIPQPQPVPPVPQIPPPPGPYSYSPYQVNPLYAPGYPNQAYPGYQQPTYPGYQQPAYPGYQQPAYPGYQQPAYPGYQQSAYPYYQAPAYPKGAYLYPTGGSSNVQPLPATVLNPGTLPQDSARITLFVPEDARVFINNEPTPNTSGVRSFYTPSLRSGVRNFYVVRMEVERNGQTFTENRRVDVAPGQNVNVNFLPANDLRTASR